MSKLLNALRDAIKSSPESPAAIARGAGIDRSRLSRLLSGERALSVEAVEQLAAYLKLEITIRPARRKGK